MDQKCTNDTRFWYKTLTLWWEHEYSCMGNSKDWRSKKVNVTELKCKVVKKVATPHFYINLPFSSLSLLSHKKIHSPQLIQFLEGPTPLFPPPPLIRCRLGGRVQLCSLDFVFENENMKLKNIWSLTWSEDWSSFINTTS